MTRLLDRCNFGRLSTAVVLCILVLRVSAVEAQGRSAALRPANSPPRDSITVTVAMVDSLPLGGAHALVLRHRGRSGGSVILLARRADALDLNGAAQSLVALRRTYGDGQDAELRRYSAHPRRPSQFDAMDVVRAELVLQQLRSAALTPVRGVGLVKAVMWKLPPAKK